MEQDLASTQQDKDDHAQQEHQACLPALLVSRGVNVTCSHSNDPHWERQHQDHGQDLPDRVAERCQEQIHGFALLPSAADVPASCDGGCMGGSAWAAVWME